jgi:hypothetical protein
MKRYDKSSECVADHIADEETCPEWSRKMVAFKLMMRIAPRSVGLEAGKEAPRWSDYTSVRAGRPDAA